jgi:hypothetical protein
MGTGVLHRRAVRLRRTAERHERQGGDDLARPQQRVEIGSTASPIVAALLEIMARASELDRVTTGALPARHGRSPHSASARSASAQRSPVPIAPIWCTAGTAPESRATTSASSNRGSTPDPPAASWLSRTAIIARARSGGSSSPAPLAWLRSRRSPCPAASSVTVSMRLAPTPVERP